MKDVERDLSTRHGWQLPERAAIQPHAPQHRKHLAVYRKCLMKARSAYVDSVTGDDFSWFLRFLTTDIPQITLTRMMQTALFISSEFSFGILVRLDCRKMSTGGPWRRYLGLNQSHEWCAALLFTVSTINVFPVYHPLPCTAPDLWNANEARGCLFVLLHRRLNKQWRAPRALLLLCKGNLPFICIRFHF